MISTAILLEPYQKFRVSGVLPALAWVQELSSCLNRALDGQIMGVTLRNTADPLKKVARMSFQPELSTQNYQPLQTISQAFAQANKCTLERIRRDGRDLLFEILIRRRLGPRMDRNPLLDKK
jgi:hypothetical protein